MLMSISLSHHPKVATAAAPPPPPPVHARTATHTQSHTHTHTPPCAPAVAQAAGPAGPALPDMAMAAAAHAAASTSDIAGQHLHGLAMWASDRLGVVQTIDPAAFDTLRTSLSGLLEGVRDALHIETAHHTVHWTNTLVLGVQQLVTALHMPGVGGASVESMLAAQEAMKVRAHCAHRCICAHARIYSFTHTCRGAWTHVLTFCVCVRACVPQPHKPPHKHLTSQHTRHMQAAVAGATAVSAEAVSVARAAGAVTTAGEMPAGLSGLLQVCRHAEEPMWAGMLN